MSKDPADTAGSFVGEAVGVQTLMTVGAGAAGADAGQNHPIADRDGADGRSDLDDRSDPLVTEDAAGLHRGYVSLEYVEVRATDRGGIHAYHHVSRLLDRSVRYLFPCLVAWAVVNQCSHWASFLGIRLDVS